MLVVKTKLHPVPPQGDVAQPHWLFMLGVKKKPHPVPMWRQQMFGHGPIVFATTTWYSVSVMPTRLAHRNLSCCMKLVGVVDNHVRVWKQSVGPQGSWTRLVYLMEVAWVPENFIDDYLREEEFVVGKYCVWVQSNDFVEYGIEEVGIIANVDICEGASVYWFDGLIGRGRLVWFGERGRNNGSRLMQVSMALYITHFFIGSFVNRGFSTSDPTVINSRCFIHPWL